MVASGEGDAGPSVVCAGILVADLFVPPLPRLPSPGELLLVEDFLLDTGGCAANTATCLARLGVRVSVSGKVGNDSFGDFIEQDLRRKGVEITGVKRSTTYGTSKTVILPVAGADRRFIHTIGANADFTAHDIDRALLARAQVFYLGGYFVLPQLKQAELAEAFRFARAQGACTVLDVVAPASDSAASLEGLLEILPHVDVFMPNDEEARALTGETEPRRQAERFLAAGCGTAIITRGAQGTLLMSTQQTIEAPAPQMATVDQSGAGDAFAAGYITGLLDGWSAAEALSFASVLGASACTRLGCTPGAFTRAQAESYLQSNPPALCIGGKSTRIRFGASTAPRERLAPDPPDKRSLNRCS
jgi:sugar/nucleoside kinase (ribokinase family)